MSICRSFHGSSVIRLLLRSHNIHVPFLLVVVVVVDRIEKIARILEMSRCDWEFLAEFLGPQRIFPSGTSQFPLLVFSILQSTTYFPAYPL
jgi:hypothetical protein